MGRLLAPNTKRLDRATVTVAPLSSKSISVGSYPAASEPRAYSLDIEPDIGDLLAFSLDRVDIPGEKHYLLICQLHNFDSTKICRVSTKRLTRRTPDKARRAHS